MLNTNQKFSNAATTLFFFMLLIPIVVRADRAEKNVGQQKQFHPASTDAEKALDLAFKIYANNAMTPRLLKVVISAEEKHHYKECPSGMHGELCEYAHPALTCGAVFHDTYVYHTTSSNENEATIDAIWEKFAAIPNADWDTYKLVKNGEKWMIDGIDCGGLYKFNISTKELLSRFHPPASDPEKALAKILSLDHSDKGIFEFIFGNSSTPADNKKYAVLFTKSLVSAWAEKEKYLVQENCGGEYKDGEICGMDFDPISCGQDSNDEYFYRTIISNAREALVVYSWPHDMVHGSRPYKLIKENDGWKLDGVDCGEGYRFNIEY